MNWHAEIAAEFARRRTLADPSVLEEMAQHASATFEAARAEGLSASDAEASVRALIRSWCSGTAGPRRLERSALIEAPPGTSILSGLSLDLRLAFRLLRREPGFALVSIAMIAVAIAATTSIFSVVDGVLLKPLPWAKVEGLVRVIETGRPELSATPTMQNVTYLAWADSPQTIDGLGSWSVDSMSLDGASGVELVSLANVTASLFPLLGVAPVLGTNFTDADERTDDKVILSYAFWQERFGAAPDVLGKRLVLGGKAPTIIGVMPRGFDFPTRDVRMWLTDHVPQVVERETRGTTVSISMRFTLHNALARLKPGVTSEQAASEAVARGRGALSGDEIFAKIRSGVFRRDGVPQITVTPMLDWLVKDVKPALWILLTAVTLLFAAAAGNVANMQLARATSRQKEIAIRSAMGAGGGRLTRQLFVETSVIAVMGGALGFGLTLVLMRVLPTLMPEDFPRVHDIAVDRRVLLVVTALTIAVSVVISLLPVRMARRVNLTSTLAEDGAAPVGQSLRSPAARSRALIITSQVAIAALLLVGAALLSQSFLKLIYIDRGYQPANLLTARITHIAHGLPADARPTFYKEVLNRLTPMPGVTHAALSNGLPLTLKKGHIAGEDPTNPGQAMGGALQIVSIDYIATMGMRIVRGRGFTNQDVPASELVVFVNETFANRYLSSELSPGNKESAPLDVMTMESRLMRSLARPRLYALLFGSFATFALLIAGIGLFGGLSYGVTQRTREIGVRTALGATPRDIIALVVKQGALMTVVGLVIGLGLAAATVRYLAGFLFGLTPFDPATFGVVGVALLLVAIVACAIPARRAARIDAITALRH